MAAPVTQKLNLQLERKVGDLEVYSYSDPFSTTGYGGKFIFQNGQPYGGKDLQSYNGTQVDRIVNDYMGAGQVQKVNRADGSSYYSFTSPDRSQTVNAASLEEATAKRNSMFKNFDQTQAEYAKNQGYVEPGAQGSVGLDYFSKYFNLTPQELTEGRRITSPANSPLPNQVQPSQAQPTPTPVNPASNPQNSATQITRDAKGSYVFGGKAYETLDYAMAAAKRSGVQASYTPPPVAAPVNTQQSNIPGKPSRDTYAAGPNGDLQYQRAMDRWNTKNNPLPASLDDATNPDQFDALLNKIQTDNFDNSSDSNVPTRSNSDTGLGNATGFFQKFLSGETSANPTTGDTSAPSFNAESKLTQLRSQYGIDPLEGQVADIDKQIADIQASQRQLQQNEEGKTVPLNVISNRVSEEQRQTNERLDALNRQKGYIVDQLNNKYNVVNSLMQAAQTDYKNAVDAYERKFNENVQATNMLMNIDQNQKSMAEKARDDARANLTIVTNALSNGTLSWENLDPKTKAQYTKLEIQAGLPTGTISAFSQKPGSAWEMSTVLPGVDQNGNAIATVLQKNKQTGEFKTTKLITDYAPNSGKQGAALQNGTFVDDQGNEVAWSRYADGTIQKSVIGKARTTENQMTPEEKAQNEFQKFFTDLVTKMNAQDSFGEPKLSREGAVKIIKAKYPTISQQSIDALFNSVQ